MVSLPRVGAGNGPIALPGRHWWTRLSSAHILIFSAGALAFVANLAVTLVLGDRRLDTDALSRVAGGGRVERSSLNTVREATGYAAGGTPPFGHATALRVFADTSLRRHDPVWAAAGTPSTVFPISVDDLDRISAPVWAEISH